MLDVDGGGKLCCFMGVCGIVTGGRNVEGMVEGSGKGAGMTSYKQAIQTVQRLTLSIHCGERLPL